LSTAASFTKSDLSEGVHTIFFKVQDDQDVWSREVSALVVNVSCASPMGIMPLGDSITYGVGEISSGEYITGYRQPLHSSLLNNDYYVDFVGDIITGSLAVPVFDVEHQGVPGLTDNGVAVNIYNWLVQDPADIVLLHIGTNNFNTSPSDVVNILNEIDRYENDHNTSVIVLLARIINRKTYHADTTTFNNNVQLMAEERIANGDKIILVDQESALNYSVDMFDNLHPKNTGYVKMANVWMSALTGVLPVCDQAVPYIFTRPATDHIDRPIPILWALLGAVVYNLLTAPSG
jgi:lysophospholipase L1-like esterase